MSFDWKFVKLADICIKTCGIQTGPFGSQLHNKDYVKIGTPIITVEHLGDNRITHQNLPRVSDKDKHRLSKYTLTKGDIVFSRVGSVDRRALIRENEEGWLFSGRCLRVRLDLSKADPAYIAFQLGTETFKEYIRAIAVGATMPSINTKILSDIKIKLPPLIEQKNIATILTALDDKIELNRQMCKTLEDIASTLFKSWFIDFDPVKAKAQGREPEGLSREIAVLFPDSFVDSHLGPIPSGWKTGKLKNIINQIKPTVNPANFPAEVFFHYSLPSYDTSKIPATVYGTSIKSNKTIISQDCVLLSKLNPETARVWLPQKQNRLRSVCSTEFLAYEPTGYFSRDYLYCLFLESSFRATLHGMVTGTSKSHQRVQPRAILELNCLIPPQQIIESFDNSMKALFNYIEVINIQSCTLAQMRDSLLPKLIIGELKIKDEKVDCGR